MVRLYLHDTEFTEKPNDKQIGMISNTITKNLVDISIEELALSLSNGQSVLPSIMLHNKRKKIFFQSTELLLLDIDNENNDLCLDDLLSNEFILNNCSFIYESFSSISTHPKFRLVFKLFEPIKTEVEFYRAYSYLLDMLPYGDKMCRDCVRIYFGGRNLTVLDYNSTLSIPYEYEDSYRKVRTIEHSGNEESLDIIKEFNLEDVKNHVIENGLEINQIVNNKLEGMKLLHKVDMYELFGLPSGTFNCILYVDTKPSASVLRLDSGEYIYKRFSTSNINLNNIQLIQQLTKQPYEDLIPKLFEVFGIKIKYEKAIIQKEFKINNFIYMLDMVTKENYPNIYKILNPQIHIVKGILGIIRDYKYEYIDSEGNIKVEFMNDFGIRKLAKMILGEVTQSKLNRTSKTISLLSYLGILEKLSDEKIPKEILDKLNKSKNYNMYENRQNLVGINFDSMVISKMEEKCMDLVDNGYTFRSFGADFLKINIDLDTAKEVFNQDKQEKITQKLLNFTSDLEELLSSNDFVYILEKDLKELLSNKYGQTYIRDNYNKVISSVLFNRSFSRQKLNKSLKEQLQISEIESSPFVIYRL